MIPFLGITTNGHELSIIQKNHKKYLVLGHPHLNNSVHSHNHAHTSHHDHSHTHSTSDDKSHADHVIELHTIDNDGLLTLSPQKQQNTHFNRITFSHHIESKDKIVLSQYVDYLLERPPPWVSQNKMMIETTQIKV